MFKLRTSDTSFLKNILESVLGLVTEGTFELNPSGMKLMAMDPAGASMIMLSISGSAFDSFEASETSITINLEFLLKVLKRSRAEDVLVLEVLDEENKLKILFQGDSARSFMLPLIEPLDSEHKIPALEFTCNVKIDPKLFRDAVTDASMVSESVTFDVSEKGFEMCSEGDSQGFHMILSKDVKGFSFDGRAKARYSIDYLAKMLKPSAYAEDLSLGFGNDYPLQMEYRVKEKLSVKFILAPRIELD
jgi:proliferating cell nuclear antigen